MTTDLDPLVPRRPGGRPRDPEVDRAVLRAAVEVMSDVGIRGVTVRAVAERAGVARATIYRRWPTRDALMGALTRAETGGRVADMTGDIEGDIRAASQTSWKIMSSPTFIGLLPELVAAFLEKPPQVSFASVAPNRRAFAGDYRKRAAAQGFVEDVDPHLAFDLFLGALLIHILANGSPPSQRYVRQLADTVVAGLRAKPDGDGR